MPNLTGIIVAGGQSRRLGHDKRRLRLWGANGPTLLEHTLGVIAPLCDELVVVLNDPEDWTDLPARLVPDLYADAGSLGGIYAGLAAASTSWGLVVAADMPLLNRGLLEMLLARPRDYDALVPRSPDPEAARNRLSVEPLHAIYSRSCLPALKETLDSGQRRIISFLDRVRTVVVEPDELVRYDPHGDSFHNINTPEELDAVRRKLGDQ